MGHAICALVVPAPIDVDRAAALDLRVALDHSGLVVLPIDHYYSAYWAAVRGVPGVFDRPPGLPAIFPVDAVLADLVAEVTGRDDLRFAIVQTDYFGGAGNQWAVVLRGRTPETGCVSINAALAALGVRAEPPKDAFATIGLTGLRSNPEHLERYAELCDELGV